MVGLQPPLGADETRPGLERTAANVEEKGATIVDEVRGGVRVGVEPSDPVPGFEPDILRLEGRVSKLVDDDAARDVLLQVRRSVVCPLHPEPRGEAVAAPVRRLAPHLPVRGVVPVRHHRDAVSQGRGALRDPGQAVHALRTVLVAVQVHVHDPPVQLRVHRVRDLPHRVVERRAAVPRAAAQVVLDAADRGRERRPGVGHGPPALPVPRRDVHGGDGVLGVLGLEHLEALHVDRDRGEQPDVVRLALARLVRAAPPLPEGVDLAVEHLPAAAAQDLRVRAGDLFLREREHRVGVERGPGERDPLDREHLHEPGVVRGVAERVVEQLQLRHAPLRDHLVRRDPPQRVHRRVVVVPPVGDQPKQVLVRPPAAAVPALEPQLLAVLRDVPGFPVPRVRLLPDLDAEHGARAVAVVVPDEGVVAEAGPGHRAARGAPREETGGHVPVADLLHRGVLAGARVDALGELAHVLRADGNPVQLVAAAAVPVEVQLVHSPGCGGRIGIRQLPQRDGTSRARLPPAACQRVELGVLHPLERVPKHHRDVVGLPGGDLGLENPHALDRAILGHGGLGGVVQLHVAKQVGVVVRPHELLVNHAVQTTLAVGPLSLHPRYECWAATERRAAVGLVQGFVVAVERQRACVQPREGVVGVGLLLRGPDHGIGAVAVPEELEFVDVPLVLDLHDVRDPPPLAAEVAGPLFVHASADLLLHELGRDGGGRVDDRGQPSLVFPRGRVRLRVEEVLRDGNVRIRGQIRAVAGARGRHFVRVLLLQPRRPLSGTGGLQRPAGHVPRSGNFGMLQQLRARVEPLLLVPFHSRAVIFSVDLHVRARLLDEEFSPRLRQVRDRPAVVRLSYGARHLVNLEEPGILLAEPPFQHVHVPIPVVGLYVFGPVVFDGFLPDALRAQLVALLVQEPPGRPLRPRVALILQVVGVLVPSAFGWRQRVVLWPPSSVEVAAALDREHPGGRSR
mmetsp:Transcript_21888/g.55133  ORF Transcript_21888/g.55133 Transcript_21888/m.55133 type:complete len:964 (-) Transcript_21888:1197-4088(-)